MHLFKYITQHETDKFLEKMEPFVDQAQKEINVLEGVIFIILLIYFKSIKKYLY